MSISARTRITTLGAALVLGAIVAGCGGSTPAATTAPTAVATAEPVVSAAPATPVVAPTELPKKLCLVIPAKIEGVKINNPALKGTIAPIIALVAGKPICVLGNGGTPVGDIDMSKTTVLRIGVGKKAAVRPGDLVGAITGEAGIESKYVGAISVQHDHSTVQVPADIADRIMLALKKTTIRGKKVDVKIDK